MAKKRKVKKIVRYRRPLNINIGMIIFFLIFVYMSFYVYTYIRRDKTQFYEVKEGGIVNDKSYTGLILRQEEIKYTDRAGYANCYIREGKRASVGTRVYSVDETGSLSEFLESQLAANGEISDRDMTELKRQLSSFSQSYSDQHFSQVYDAKYSLDSSVAEFMNLNSRDDLDSALAEAGISYQQVRSDQSGIVSYIIDSYTDKEGNTKFYSDLTSASITEEAFDRSGYNKTITKSGELLEKDGPAYKIITSEQWSLVFQLTEDDVKEYSSMENLEITFPGYGLTINGKFTISAGADGKSYGKVDFDKYLVQFASERFIKFEVNADPVQGLKIPVTSVISKDFFLVPIDYLSQGGDSSDSGFYKEVYSDKGTSVVFVPTTLYSSNDQYYYINISEDGELKAGDYIVKPDAGDRYQLGQTASLQGVYNINKGYAVFKQIEVLSSNEEYYTVKKGTRYGLSVYDHIVLNANTVYEGAIVYQ